MRSLPTTQRMGPPVSDYTPTVGHKIGQALTSRSTVQVSLGVVCGLLAVATGWMWNEVASVRRDAAADTRSVAAALASQVDAARERQHAIEIRAAAAAATAAGTEARLDKIDQTLATILTEMRRRP